MKLPPLLNRLFAPESKNHRHQHRFPAEALEARIAPAANAWIGAGSGNWTDPTNWSDGVPTADDDVTINPAGTLTITIPSGAQVANTITMPGDDTLSVFGGLLTIAQASSVNNLMIGGGGVVANGLLTLTGNSVWSGDTTITGSFRNVGTLSVAGTPNLGGVLENAGTINDTGRLDFLPNGRLNNLASGVFDITGSASDNYVGDFGGVGIFNDGTFRHSGTGSASIGAVPFHNSATGVIEVTDGTLNLGSNGTWESANFLVSDGKTLNLNGGTKTWTGTYTGSGGGAVNVTFNTITIGAGGATLNFPAGMFNLKTGATINGAAFSNTGTISIAGTPHLGTTLNNTGTINDNVRLDFFPNGRLNNLPSGVFDITGSADDFFVANFGGVGIFNDGIFRQSGTGSASLGTVPFSNTGLVQVATGTLTLSSQVAELSGNTLTDGTWEVADGAALTFPAGTSIITNAGTLIKHGSGTISGLGALKTNSGSIQLLDGATMTVTSNFTNSGSLLLGVGSQLTATANFTQTATGRLAFEIGGTPAGA